MKEETTQAAPDALLILSQGNKELHDAMSYFLYLRPEEQLIRLGTTDHLIQNAAEALGRGDRARALVDYTDAAWVESYRGNKANVKLYLERALSLQGVDGRGREFAPRLNTLLSHLEEVMTISKRYYQQDGATKTGPGEPTVQN